MKVVIMAGGKGTRIASVNSEIPKPMIRINDKPILHYQIECLKNQGLTDIIIVIGHLGNVIKEYFGDGSDFGVTISYIEENQPLGTAGSLYYLKNIITSDFLLLNGDVIFDINIERFYTAHKKNKGLATIFTHPNDHPYDSGIIITDDSQKVLNWLHKEDDRKWYKNRVNAGIHIISTNLLDMFTEPKKIDLDRDILKTLIEKEQLYTYDSPEYVKDMGTPERYQEVIDDINSGKVKSKNLENKQKAIFLDRDGTINEYKEFLTNINDFTLIDGVAEGIKQINKLGYLAIVITNQPVIARGELSIMQLQEIHNKMETLLGNNGAYIDSVFYCPHHPHKGYVGERVEYKIECDCRKPKPGMFFDAAKKYNIDLTQSFMIGDSLIDIEAGTKAGCTTVLINGNTNNDDFVSQDLKDAVKKIVSFIERGNSKDGN